ncbi:polyketide synthase [Beggiatoa sp. SS]|nr:polyketide synthase [Beggiatoa sp. SS]
MTISLTSGGHSFLIIQVQAKLQTVFALDISVVELFEHPTIHALAQHLGQTQCTPEFIPEPEPHRRSKRSSSNEIAIIGLSGRFPGASDIEMFWQNLQHGVESITFFSDEELQSSGIDRATLNKPNYVKASAVLSDIDQFDASFFDINPKEAEMTDPQQRLFLECAWEALENAGYEAGTDEQAIGVYAGMGMNTYLLNNLSKNSELTDTGDAYQVMDW